MPDYKALKVKIGLKPNGYAAYPEFNTLSVIISSGLDWSYYIQSNGTGWLYDKKYGHAQEGPDSPVGTQWGVLVVDPTFADQAVAAFPTECSLLTEAELQQFIDGRSTAHLPEEEVDVQVLAEMREQLELMEQLEKKGRSNAALISRRSALEERAAKALDPTDDEPGVKVSENKKWVAIKKKFNVNII